MRDSLSGEIVFLAQEAPEGGFCARALGHAIFTQAETWEELERAVCDAVDCHFKPEEKPTLVRLRLVRQEVLAA